MTPVVGRRAERPFYSWREPARDLQLERGAAGLPASDAAFFIGNEIEKDGCHPRRETAGRSNPPGNHLWVLFTLSRRLDGIEAVKSAKLTPPQQPRY